MGQAKSGAERPLSPHLSVYRPMLTMLMSIAHRISGAANAIGFLLLAWWLVAIAAGPEAYAQVSQPSSEASRGACSSFMFSWSLIHHMLGGIRHLIWDTGHGLDKVSIELFAWATIIGSTVLTVLVWVAGYWLKGGSDMTTALKRVRGLGSARSGTETFWRQRAHGGRQHSARHLPDPLDRHPYRRRLRDGSRLFRAAAGRDRCCSRWSSRQRFICASG